MMNLRPAIVLGLIVALQAISPHTHADTSQERMIGRVERDKRGTNRLSSMRKQGKSKKKAMTVFC